MKDQIKQMADEGQNAMPPFRSRKVAITSTYKVKDGRRMHDDRLQEMERDQRIVSEYLAWRHPYVEVENVSAVKYDCP